MSEEEKRKQNNYFDFEDEENLIYSSSDSNRDFNTQNRGVNQDDTYELISNSKSTIADNSYGEKTNNQKERSNIESEIDKIIEDNHSKDVSASEDKKVPKNYVYSAYVKKIEDDDFTLESNEYRKEEIFTTSDNEKYKIIYTAEESKEKIDYKKYQLNKKREEFLEKIKPKVVGYQTVAFEFLKSILPALSIVVLVLIFIVRISFVDGKSMENTLQDNDVLIVTNFLYDAQIGDVVTVSHGQEYEEAIVKRVIATEGQSVKIDYENDTVAVDGIVIDEPYIKEVDMVKSTNDVIDFIVVPEDMIFVMGDNRNNSSDSRSKEIGLINVDDVIGKAQCVVFPFNRIQYLY